MNEIPMWLVMVLGIVACLVGVYILMPVATCVLDILHN
jgi:hypothetical protein